LAISDPYQKIASPLEILPHISRHIDCARIAQIALDHHVCMIIIGCVTDIDGNIGPQGRKSQKLLDSLKLQIDLPIFLWDESDTSKIASQLLPFYGRNKRQQHNDDLAATVILQQYLDDMHDKNELPQAETGENDK
jgi:putative Holliday junction resolvase